MFTSMRSDLIDETSRQKCWKVWWTIYNLERQMSSLMGIPMGIADDCITAGVPSFPGNPQREATLNIQIKLSGVLAQIHQSEHRSPVL